VTGAVVGQDTQMHLDASEYTEGILPMLQRPKFLAIVSSNTLATTDAAAGERPGKRLVIETPTAAGTNAPRAGSAAQRVGRGDVR